MCIQIHPTQMKTLFQKQERECFISQTNMKLSFKTLHKFANILDCKRCSFLL